MSALISSHNSITIDNSIVSNLSLVPSSKHLSDYHVELLAKSGISREDAIKAGMHTVTGSEGAALVGAVRSINCNCLAIPYYHPLTKEPLKAENGKHYVALRLDIASGFRYLYPSGKGRLYYSPLADWTKVKNNQVFLLEGAKDANALSGVRDKNSNFLLTIGLNGCWGWSEKITNEEGRPEQILKEDLKLVDLRSACLYVVSDSDISSKPDVARAYELLCKALSKAYAQIPMLIRVLGDSDGSKKDISDYCGLNPSIVRELCVKKNSEALGAFPSITIKKKEEIFSYEIPSKLVPVVYGLAFYALTSNKYYLAQYEGVFEWVKTHWRLMENVDCVSFVKQQLMLLLNAGAEHETLTSPQRFNATVASAIGFIPEQNRYFPDRDTISYANGEMSYKIDVTNPFKPTINPVFTEGHSKDSYCRHFVDFAYPVKGGTPTVFMSFLDRFCRTTEETTEDEVHKNTQYIRALLLFMLLPVARLRTGDNPHNAKRACQHLPIIHGVPGCGKSVLLGVFTSLLPKKLAGEFKQYGDFDPAGNNGKNAQNLYNAKDARLFLATDGESFQTSIKSTNAVLDGERLTLKLLYKQPVSLALKMSLILMATNKFPRVNHEDKGGFERRVQIFSAPPALPKSLRDNGLSNRILPELGQIVHWALSLSFNEACEILDKAQTDTPAVARNVEIVESIGNKPREHFEELIATRIRSGGKFKEVSTSEAYADYKICAERDGDKKPLLKTSYEDGLVEANILADSVVRKGRSGKRSIIVNTPQWLIDKLSEVEETIKEESSPQTDIYERLDNLHQKSQDEVNGNCREILLGNVSDREGREYLTLESETVIYTEDRNLVILFGSEIHGSQSPLTLLPKWENLAVIKKSCNVEKIIMIGGDTQRVEV